MITEMIITKMINLDFDSLAFIKAKNDATVIKKKDDATVNGNDQMRPSRPFPARSNR